MSSSTEPNIRVSPTLSDEAKALEEQALPAPGDVLSGHRIIQKLTHGGFGTVFLADNLGLPGQRTVVKAMPLGQLSEREADVLRHIDHPTVVKVLALGRTETFQYIVMEYLQGETLDALLGKYHQIGPIQTVRIGLRIADALDAVHEKGLVHRDLKPANIMLKLAKDHGKFVDWLKLIDFGLARDHGHQMTQAEGTPEYVAPETLQQQPVTPSSDLYALGVILHEMLTGQRPYQASSVHVMVSQHVNAIVPHVRDLAPDVSVELDQLVFELMSKEPSQRPQSASEVAKRLARLEREMSDGSTGIAMMPPGVLAAAEAEASTAKGSTVIAQPPLVLGSPLTKRATAEPTPLLLPVQLKHQRRWPWVVGAMLLLLLLWFLDGVFTVNRVQEVVAKVIETPAAEVATLKVPAPVPAKPAELDEVAPLRPSLTFAPKRTTSSQPIVVTRPGQFQVTESECKPTQQWHAAQSKDLRELGTRVANDPKRNAIYEEVEPRLSQQIRNAANVSECATVQKQMQSLKQRLGVE